MTKPPKVCPNCAGYGLLFEIMHLEPEVVKGAHPDSVAAEQLPVYYPERQVATVSPDTLYLWRRNCEKEIRRLEDEKKKLLGGISQIDTELERRRTARSAGSA